MLDASSASARLLGSDGAEDSDPQFSPDGSKLLFRSNRSGNWELWLGDADGGNAHRLTDDPGNDSVPLHFCRGEGPGRFSPDGRRIVWTRRSPERGFAVWIMDANGGNARNLTADHAGSDSYPAFSPDGQRIAFNSDRDGDHEIYLMTAASCSA